MDGCFFCLLYFYFCLFVLTFVCVYCVYCVCVCVSQTGEVKDSHDIISVETRYLSKASKNKINDSKLMKQNYIRKKGGVLTFLFWIAIFTLSVFLIAETLSEIQTIKEFKSNQVFFSFFFCFFVFLFFLVWFGLFCFVCVIFVFSLFFFYYFFLK